MRKSAQTSLDVFGIASSAKKHLDDDAINGIARFVMSKMNEDGGFQGRSSSSDLYYTFFALASLAGLGVSKPVSPAISYVNKIDASRLGFIDLYCLACTKPMLAYLRLPDKFKALALLTARKSGMFAGRPVKDILGRLEGFRSKDGGYNQNTRDSRHGTVYASFLACQAYENLGLDIPDKNGILNSLEDLKASDGGYANQPDMAFGTTTATAAAAIIKLHLENKSSRAAAKWLLGQQLPSGGFRASPHTPIADMLSTATAVLALRQMGHKFESRQEIIDFVEAHWDDSGGFFGSALDPVCDCEYTFYGLLILGCLLE